MADRLGLITRNAPLRPPLRRIGAGSLHDAQPCAAISLVRGLHVIEVLSSGHSSDDPIRQKLRRNLLHHALSSSHIERARINKSAQLDEVALAAPTPAQPQALSVKLRADRKLTEGSLADNQGTTRERASAEQRDTVRAFDAEQQAD